MNKDLPLPVCVKMNSGETLFAEHLRNVSGNHIVLRNVFSVIIGNNMQFGITKWIPFTEESQLPLSPGSITSIVPLDNIHKKEFGKMLLSIDIDEIKSDVYNMMLNSPIIPSEWLETKFEQLLDVTMHNALVYERLLPDSEELKESFHSFIIKQYEPETETKQ